MLTKLYLVVKEMRKKFAQKIHSHIIENKCNQSAGTIFYYPHSAVDNLQEKQSSITVGKNTHIKGQLLVFPNGGQIKIGDDCFIGENSRVWSMNLIDIGCRVLISHGVNIHDNNAHSISASKRHEHFMRIVSIGHPKILDTVRSAPVKIGDDVWIGFNASIMKGVSIGSGAIIGANSVVIEDIPPYSISIGNPSKVVGYSKV